MLIDGLLHSLSVGHERRTQVWWRVRLKKRVRNREANMYNNNTGKDVGLWSQLSHPTTPSWIYQSLIQYDYTTTYV